jgi:hypothetical protein
MFPTIENKHINKTFLDLLSHDPISAYEYLAVLSENNVIPGPIDDFIKTVEKLINGFNSTGYNFKIVELTNRLMRVYLISDSFENIPHIKRVCEAYDKTQPFVETLLPKHTYSVYPVTQGEYDERRIKGDL